ncbi:hypothetical protein BGZ91_010697 [Linnemannia elongata]|nr:hypothetical protein BGZ91_010697 [Linnemannia elongata]
MDNNPLTLFCLVDGLPSSRAFEIEVSKIRTIAHLKDLIKAKEMCETLVGKIDTNGRKESGLQQDTTHKNMWIEQFEN